MNHSQQDELAALFSQRMTFAPQQVSQEQVIEMTTPEIKTNEPAFVSISAHYNHSTHIRSSADATSEPSHSPPPPYNDSVMPEAMAQLLRDNSVDPASLLPNQIELFGNADYEQRLRLLELWRISPPSYLPKVEYVEASWAPTSMQQEELLAKVRFETQMAARAVHAYQQGWHKQSSDLDTHIEPMSPIRAPGEPAWPPAARMRAASIQRTIPKPTNDAEPYIVSGYQNTSTDPVYAAAPSLWQAPSYAHTMEDQYGQMMQIRNHAEWEAMNERLAQEKLSGMINTSTDDDMVM